MKQKEKRLAEEAKKRMQELKARQLAVANNNSDKMHVMNKSNRLDYSHTYTGPLFTLNSEGGGDGGGGGGGSDTMSESVDYHSISDAVNPAAFHHDKSYLHHLSKPQLSKDAIIESSFRKFKYRLKSASAKWIHAQQTPNISILKVFSNIIIIVIIIHHHHHVQSLYDFYHHVIIILVIVNSL